MIILAWICLLARKPTTSLLFFFLQSKSLYYSNRFFGRLFPAKRKKGYSNRKNLFMSTEHQIFDSLKYLQPLFPGIFFYCWYKMWSSSTIIQSKQMYLMFVDGYKTPKKMFLLCHPSTCSMIRKILYLVCVESQEQRDSIVSVYVRCFIWCKHIRSIYSA